MSDGMFSGYQTAAGDGRKLSMFLNPGMIDWFKQTAIAPIWARR